MEQCSIKSLLDHNELSSRCIKEAHCCAICNLMRQTSVPKTVCLYLEEIKNTLCISAVWVGNFVSSNKITNFKFNFVLLIVPRRYFCGGSFCFMSWCLNFFVLLAPYVCFHIFN